MQPYPREPNLPQGRDEYGEADWGSGVWMPVGNAIAITAVPKSNHSCLQVFECPFTTVELMQTNIKMRSGTSKVEPRYVQVAATGVVQDSVIISIPEGCTQHKLCPLSLCA